jgi:replicative DNA helicase Mcm
MVDTVEATRDREIARFILDLHQMKPVHTEGEIVPLDPDFLKKYIIYASEIKPLLSAEAADVIEKFYVDLRKSAEGGAAPVPITARQLESLVRLSEARAKMALRSKVTKEDAQAALRLMEESLRMVALDRITGKIDIDSLVSSQTKSQRNISDSIIKALRDLESEGTTTVDEEVLIQRTIAMGHPRDRVEEMIKKLLADGILYSPRDGKIRHSQS